MEIVRGFVEHLEQTEVGGQELADGTLVIAQPVVSTLSNYTCVLHV